MSKSNFDDYLRDEYKNIAEAHFRTIEGISSFFRYYLLIMSAPIPILALFASVTGQVQSILVLTENFRFLAFGLLLAISIAGFLVTLYIINLRMDAILCARTVNSIRKHFFDSSTDLKLDTKIHMRVLPQSNSQPDYFEPRYFLPVILAFTIFNVFYFIAAVAIYSFSYNVNDQSVSIFADIPLWFLISVPFAYAILHLALYKGYAQHRERTYLRSYALGVDIDGVMNKHEHQFCKLLFEKTGKNQDPNQITTIPLHDCILLNISRDEEKVVFNDPRYWIDMPVNEGVTRNFDRLRGLNVKIHIFSHRPWPDTHGTSEDSRKALQTNWKKEAERLLKEASRDDPLIYRILWFRLKIGVSEIDPWDALWFDVPKNAKLFWERIRDRLGIRPIEVITRGWLYQNKLQYASLTIERGNENVADPQGHFRNRFQISRNKMLRYFVEDDIEKAEKLAYICDVVFLVEHPYNTGFEKQCEGCNYECKREKIDLPDNVRTVKSWDEIYKRIRLLS